MGIEQSLFRGRQQHRRSVALGAKVPCPLDAEVEFVVIRGVAAISHGHVRATLDLNVGYARSPLNHARLVREMEGLEPRLPGAPEGLPLFWDEATLRNGLGFTLTTPARLRSRVRGYASLAAVRATGEGSA